MASRAESRKAQGIRTQVAIKSLIADKKTDTTGVTAVSAASGAAIYDYWLAQEKLGDERTPHNEHGALVRESTVSFQKLDQFPK